MNDNLRLIEESIDELGSIIEELLEGYTELAERHIKLLRDYNALLLRIEQIEQGRS